MTRTELARWLERYERAWRSPGTEALGGLFAADATYSPAPYEDTVHGLERIGEFWEANREGADEAFTMASEIVAVEGNVGVAHVEIHYCDPRGSDYRDLWIVVLDDDGRCAAFEEWPFFPGQPLTSSPAR